MIKVGDLVVINENRPDYLKYGCDWIEYYKELQPFLVTSVMPDFEGDEFIISLNLNSNQINFLKNNCLGLCEETLNIISSSFLKKDISKFEKFYNEEIK
ncbi:MAG: hypothetical protein ABIP51_11195 [Bacteroidia bacterium]